MTCWRCGHPEDDHTDWCSMPGGCDHCGWSPCRWWCAEDARAPKLNFGMPAWADRPAYRRERERRIRDGEWVFA